MIGGMLNLTTLRSCAMLLLSLSLACDARDDVGEETLDDVGEHETSETSGDISQCTAGELACACLFGWCFDGICVQSVAPASICAPEAAEAPCDHGLEVEYAGIVVGGGCVASCTQGDPCDLGLECAPIGALAAGYCAWPN